MFTGLIQATGLLKKITPLTQGLALTLESPFADLNLGESISVDGACLTVVEIDYPTFKVEVSEETLDKTIVKKYQVNQKINLERALQIGERLGGHFVTGHVDQTATVKTFEKQGEFYLLEITGIKPAQQIYLIDKGSITVNGVSLTLNAISAGDFQLLLIPHTLAVTNLSDFKIGHSVNIEFDLLSKIVAKQTALGANYV